MNARSRQNVIIALLPVAMIWGAYNLFWDEKEPPLIQPEVAPQVVTTIENSTFVIDDSELSRIKNAKWGSDPFRSVIKRSPKATDKPDDRLKLILSGIIFNDKSPMAVINRKTVRPGDIINGTRIVSINRKSVTVEQNGKQFQLTVTKG